jgi:hypothetical protein
VFRSNAPGTVTDPAYRLGATTVGSWTDLSPANDSLVFYQVVSCATPAAPAPHGCASCDVCDVWGLSWAAVACTTHYVVRWKCTFVAEQAWNISATSVTDICTDIGMCERCSNGVESCNGSGCSSAVDVPASELPSQCGGGCCVP